MSDAGSNNSELIRGCYESKIGKDFPLPIRFITENAAVYQPHSSTKEHIFLLYSVFYS